jgi:hypothetical protein
MRAFRRYQLFEARGEDGKTVAERERESGRADPHEVDLNLPSEITDAETVGVIYDLEDGMSFWPDFGLLAEAFKRPELAAQRRHGEVVRGYLENPDGSPVPLRRVAEQSPEGASRVLGQLLKRPDFSWERDGEALLRDATPRYFEQPPIPSLAPLSPKLAQALAADSAPHRRAAPHRPVRSARRPAKRRGRSR